MSFSNSGGKLRMKAASHMNRDQQVALREQFMNSALTFTVELKFKPEDLAKAREWAHQKHLLGYDGIHHLLYEALINGVVRTDFKEGF